MTISLVTLKEIKEFIPTEAEFDGNDELYRTLGIRATKMIEQYCRRNFTRQEYTEYFGTRKAGKSMLDLYGSSMTGYADLNEDQSFYLSNTPIDTSADFKVYFDPKREFGEDTRLTPAIYFLRPEQGILSISTYVQKFNNSIKVVYTAGYPSATVARETTLSEAAPVDLKQACLVTVVNLFNRQQDRNAGMRQYGDTDNAADFSHFGMLPLEVKEIIHPYRKTFIGTK